MLKVATKRVCKFCESPNTKKNGRITRWRGGRKYKIQMYACNDCGRGFGGRKRYV